MEQFGHQFDQPIRKLGYALSSLNEAAMAVESLNEPELKRLIDQAISEAGAAIIAEEDKYNEKD